MSQLVHQVWISKESLIHNHNGAGGGTVVNLYSAIDFVIQ